MGIQEAPELTCSHGYTRSTSIYRPMPSERKAETVGANYNGTFLAQKKTHFVVISGNWITNKVIYFYKQWFW